MRRSDRWRWLRFDACVCVRNWRLLFLFSFLFEGVGIRGGGRGWRKSFDMIFFLSPPFPRHLAFTCDSSEKTTYIVEHFPVQPSNQSETITFTSVLFLTK